jgi:hypothetical protein
MTIRLSPRELGLKRKAQPKFEGAFNFLPRKGNFSPARSSHFSSCDKVSRRCDPPTSRAGQGRQFAGF